MLLCSINNYKSRLSALMPRAARCDFNSYNGSSGVNQHDKLCGWRNQRSSILDVSGEKFSWTRKNGKTRLEGIRGDLSIGNDGEDIRIQNCSGIDETIDNENSLYNLWNLLGHHTPRAMFELKGSKSLSLNRGLRLGNF